MKTGGFNSQMAILENEILNREKDRERIAALEQWQREAVPHLKFLRYLNKKEDHPCKLLDHDRVTVEALIKQAEGK